jgi:hypothetical protein
LNTAFQKMKEWRLRSPDVLDEGNYVRVVIPHASLATPQDARDRRDVGHGCRFRSDVRVAATSVRSGVVRGT